MTVCSDAGATASGPGAAVDPHNYCFTYAVLRERPGARRLTVCGRRDHRAVVYTSLSNSVQVRIIRPRHANDDSASYFLLEYQGLSTVTLHAYVHLFGQSNGVKQWQCITPYLAKSTHLNVVQKNNCT